MERKISIVLNSTERETLHKAGEILERMCNMADSCEECPLQAAHICEDFNGEDYNAAFSKL